MAPVPCSRYSTVRSRPRRIQKTSFCLAQPPGRRSCLPDLYPPPMYLWIWDPVYLRQPLPPSSSRRPVFRVTPESTRLPLFSKLLATSVMRFNLSSNWITRLSRLRWPNLLETCRIDTEPRQTSSGARQSGISVTGEPRRQLPTSRIYFRALPIRPHGPSQVQ